MTLGMLTRHPKSGTRIGVTFLVSSIEIKITNYLHSPDFSEVLNIQGERFLGFS